MPKLAATGAWSERRIRRPSGLLALARLGCQGGRRLDQPQPAGQQVVDRPLRGRRRQPEAVAEHVERPGAERRAQVQVPAEDERQRPGPVDRPRRGALDLAARLAGVGREVHVGHAQHALARAPRCGRTASAGARGGSRRVSRRVSTIRAGARTRTMFDPPSHEAIRSGFQSASAPWSGGTRLREVAHQRRAWARSGVQARPASAAGPPGAARSPRSAPRARSQNSSRSERLTCTWVASRSSLRSRRERQVRSAGLGGKSRPWKRFQVRAPTTMPR